MAVRVGRQLVAATRRLGAHALSGRVIDEWKNPQHRELIVGGYRVMYRLSSNEIVVFSIRHTAAGSKTLSQ